MNTDNDINGDSIEWDMEKRRRGEMQLLGCILATPPDQTSISVDSLHRDWFGTAATRQLFDAMAKAEKASGKATLFTLLDHAHKPDLMETAEDAVDCAPPISRISLCLQLVKRNTEKVRLRQRLAQLAEQSSSTDPSAIREQLSALIDVDDEAEKTGKSAAELAASSLARLDKAEKGKTIGLPVFLPELAQRIGTAQPGKICVVAGPPASGKTSFALQEMMFMATEGIPTGVISIEMGAHECLNRMASQYSHANLIHCRDNPDPKEIARLRRGLDHVANLPIRIDATCQTLTDVTSSMRYMAKAGVKAITIDYLQLIEIAGARTEAVTLYSNTIRRVAKQTGLYTILLSQLSRAREYRQSADKEPKLSDLRDSGAIEQDAYYVAFLYETESGHAFKLAKNRGGPIGKWVIGFKPEHTRFYSMAMENPKCKYADEIKD